MKAVSVLHIKEIRNQGSCPSSWTSVTLFLLCISRVCQHSRMVQRMGPEVRQVVSWVLNSGSITSLQWDEGYLTHPSLSFIFCITSLRRLFIHSTNLTDHILHMKNLVVTGILSWRREWKNLRPPPPPPGGYVLLEWNEIMDWKCFALWLEYSVYVINVFWQNEQKVYK